MATRWILASLLLCSVCSTISTDSSPTQTRQDHFYFTEAATQVVEYVPVKNITPFVCAAVIEVPEGPEMANDLVALDFEGVTKMVEPRCNSPT